MRREVDKNCLKFDPDELLRIKLKHKIAFL